MFAGKCEKPQCERKAVFTVLQTRPLAPRKSQFEYQRGSAPQWLPCRRPAGIPGRNAQVDLQHFSKHDARVGRHGDPVDLGADDLGARHERRQEVRQGVNYLVDADA